MQVVSALQVVLQNAVTAYYRLILRPSDDFDRNIIYKMVWDRRLILKVMSEKVSSLQYVRRKIPEITFAHRFYETQDISAINWENLPRNFVIKASHGSGGVVIVHEGAPKENRLPKQTKKFGWRRLEVHPDNFDKELAIEIFSKLLKSTYGQGLNRGGPEWGYWGNKPHVIIEDFLSLGGEMPMHVTCNFVRGTLMLFFWDQIFYPNLSGSRVLYSRINTPPLDIDAIASELRVPRGEIEKLIEQSSIIAGDIDYLRVDWFLSDDGIYFNELTNYCGGGVLKGKSYYQHLSEMWRPDRSDYLTSPNRGVTQ